MCLRRASIVLKKCSWLGYHDRSKCFRHRSIFRVRKTETLLTLRNPRTGRLIKDQIARKGKCNNAPKATQKFSHNFGWFVSDLGLEARSGFLISVFSGSDEAGGDA